MARTSADMLSTQPIRPGQTVGADKGYDVGSFITSCRDLGVTPHVASKVRPSCIDGRTTRHAGYQISQRKRKRVEEPVWLDGDLRIADQAALSRQRERRLAVPIDGRGVQHYPTEGVDGVIGIETGKNRVPTLEARAHTGRWRRSRRLPTPLTIGGNDRSQTPIAQSQSAHAESAFPQHCFSTGC